MSREPQTLDRAHGEPAGVVLVGHGTRSQRGRQEFEQAVAALRQTLPDSAVRGAYLELARPTIAEALAELREEGCRRLIVCPLLLLAAGHARRDLPDLVAAARQQLPDTRIELTAHLAQQPAMLRLSRRRLHEAESVAEALAGADEQRPCQNRTVILVARGGSDPDLPAQLEAFAHARQLNIPQETAFLALARPSWEEISAGCLDHPAEWVFVQPHLLFHGQMWERLEHDVLRMQEKAGQRQHWCLVPYLGPESELTEAILELLAGAMPELAGQRSWESPAARQREEPGGAADG